MHFILFQFKVFNEFFHSALMLAQAAIRVCLYVCVGISNLPCNLTSLMRSPIYSFATVFPFSRTDLNKFQLISVKLNSILRRKEG